MILSMVVSSLSGSLWRGLNRLLTSTLISDKSFCHLCIILSHLKASTVFDTDFIKYTMIYLDECIQTPSLWYHSSEFYSWFITNIKNTFSAFEASWCGYFASLEELISYIIDMIKLSQIETFTNVADIAQSSENFHNSTSEIISWYKDLTIFDRCHNFKLHLIQSTFGIKHLELCHISTGSIQKLCSTKNFHSAEVQHPLPS